MFSSRATKYLDSSMILDDLFGSLLNRFVSCFVHVDVLLTLEFDTQIINFSTEFLIYGLYGLG